MKCEVKEWKVSGCPIPGQVDADLGLSCPLRPRISLQDLGSAAEKCATRTESPFVGVWTRLVASISYEGEPCVRLRARRTGSQARSQDGWMHTLHAQKLGVPPGDPRGKLVVAWKEAHPKTPFMPLRASLVTVRSGQGGRGTRRWPRSGMKFDYVAPADSLVPHAVFASWFHLHSTLAGLPLTSRASLSSRDQVTLSTGSTS